MAALPTVYGSSGTWGSELNEFLGVSLDTDGTIKSTAFQPYVRVWDEKTEDTEGGTSAVGTNTRVLTDIYPEDSFATLSSNKITLEAGTYRCYISCPAFQVGSHSAVLYDVTGAATEIEGTSEYSGAANYAQTRSIVAGEFTITSETIFEVRHYCQTAYATSGLGLAADITGKNEIYTIAEFWKLA